MTGYDPLVIRFEYTPEREVGYKLEAWFKYLDQAFGDLYQTEEILDDVPKIRLKDEFETYW